MAKNLEIFFSNRLEVLYEQLKTELFGSSPLPFLRRIVVVYGPAMKSWLMLKMAQDPALNVAMGIEIIYLNQSFDALLKVSKSDFHRHLPTFLELALAIEKECMEVIQNFNAMEEDEQRDWMPLIQYLSVDLNKSLAKAPLEVLLSRKNEKRLIALSQQLARLFHEYGRFAPKMTARWEDPVDTEGVAKLLCPEKSMILRPVASGSYTAAVHSTRSTPGGLAEENERKWPQKDDFNGQMNFATPSTGWQPRLWGRLFKKGLHWTYSTRALANEGSPPSNLSVHFFSISFITAAEFGFLNRLSEHLPVRYYLISPCAVFWSDIRSDKESAFLQAYWQKKLGTISQKMLCLEDFLADRNPLLANFGRIGREMVSQIEESLAAVNALYVLPAHVEALNEELFFHDELLLEETSKPLSLLHAVQADLLMMRNPRGLPPVSLEDVSSIQLHASPNRRREVEILYHNLLSLIEKDPSLCPGEIIVMAPQIGDYIPYIHSVFGSKQSVLGFQILDLGMQTQSEIVHGFLELLDLSESRWDAGKLLQLFGHSSFQRRHQLTPGDCATIQSWMEQAGIRWGEDFLHRNELLLRRHCKQGMIEETGVGTWEFGLLRLLMGLTTIMEEQETQIEVSPCSVEFSQAELLEKWLQILHSLRDDLSPLEDRTRMKMDDWAHYLLCLLDHYFQPDFESPASIKDWEALKEQIELLRSSALYFKEALFSFASVKTHLLSLLQHQGITYREDCVQAVRFCSLIPLRSIPAKAIALLGMQEGAFPRTDPNSSLNMMIGNEEVDYYPLSSDYDRYLFLEALHSAGEYLLLSYQNYGQEDGKELHPSLVVEELFSYLDSAYAIGEKKPSGACIFKHPVDSFHASYFSKDPAFFNYSQQDFRAAKSLYQMDKAAPYRLIEDFTIVEQKEPSPFENDNLIELKKLTAAARNPMKLHLNHVLEIYLDSEEKRKIKIEEELTVSTLDRYEIRHSALNKPIDQLLYKAEKEGRLPLGLFKAVAEKRLKKEINDLYESLKRHSLDPSQIFQIEFCPSCTEPVELENNRWLFPAINLNCKEGSQMSIAGKLLHATPHGLLSLDKGTLADAWKIWPQFLACCHAAKLRPDILKPQLLFTQSASPKKAFFDDPEIVLQQFVDYYALCLETFSPLLPDWIPFIMAADVRGLQEKMRSLYVESFGGYQDHSMRWMLNKQHLPCAETLIQVWKPKAEELIGDLKRFWY